MNDTARCPAYPRIRVRLTSRMKLCRHDGDMYLGKDPRMPRSTKYRRYPPAICLRGAAGNDAARQVGHDPRNRSLGADVDVREI